MSISIEREIYSSGEIACTSTASTSPPFGFGNQAGALIFCVDARDGGGSALATVTVSFHAQWDATGSPFQLADATNSPVTITMAPNRCYDLPAALFGASLVRITPTTAGQTCRIRVVGKA